jgi:CubicO group peptidase (beta-lactamase class C family)
VSPATLSHFGASGTLMWADPVANRGLVCLANRSTYSGWMMRPGRWADLTAQVLAT